MELEMALSSVIMKALGQTLTLRGEGVEWDRGIERGEEWGGWQRKERRCWVNREGYGDIVESFGDKALTTMSMIAGRNCDTEGVEWDRGIERGEWKRHRWIYLNPTVGGLLM
jgi:hypothetical protein